MQSPMSNQQVPRRSAGAEKLLVFGFLASIGVPGLAALWPSNAPVHSLRGEVIAPPPTWPHSLHDVRALPTQFQKYIETNFGFRQALIFGQGLLMVRGLGVSTDPRVVLGGQGRLFTNESNALTGDYRGLQPFEPTQLACWENELLRRQAWLAARGIRYLVTIVPEAHWTYEELLPRWSTRVQPGARIDALYERMKHSPVRMVDLRPALQRGKALGRLYHRTDGHWNSLGAFVGYQALMQSLGDWFPDIKPRPLQEYRQTETRTIGGGMARFLGIAEGLSEENLALARIGGSTWTAQTVSQAPVVKDQIEVLRRELIVTEQPRGELARVVLFRDSYCEALLPFLSEHMQRASYAWTWTFGFSEALIEKEQPTLVIQEAVERTLMAPGCPK